MGSDLLYRSLENYVVPTLDIINIGFLLIIIEEVYSNKFWFILGLLLFKIYLIFQRRKIIKYLSWWKLICMLLFLAILTFVCARIVAYCEACYGFGGCNITETLLVNLSGGFYSWSGIVFALSLFYVLLVLTVSNKDRLVFFGFSHHLIIGFMLFTTLCKLGCHFSGDGCYGRPTELPWGTFYENGLVPSLLPVHPTSVYDSIFNLCMFFLFLYLTNEYWFVKYIFPLYLLLISVFHFFLELLRINPKVIFNEFTVQQSVYLFCFILNSISLYLVSMSYRKH